MYTISSVAKRHTSHCNINTMFFDSIIEAQTWIDARKASVLAAMVAAGIDIENPNIRTMEDLDVPGVTPWVKETHEQSYCMKWAYEAYFLGVDILPAAIVCVNGTQVENKYATCTWDSSNYFYNKVSKETIVPIITAMILRKETVSSITVDGVELEYAHVGTIFGEEDGLLDLDAAEKYCFWTLHNPQKHCKAVLASIKYAAKSCIQDRYQKLNALAKAIKGIL